MVKSFIKNIYMTLRMIMLKCLIRQKAVSRIDPAGVDSILIIRLDRIGDLVVSIPAISALKKIFPRCRITGLFNRASMDLVRLIPEIDEAIAYRGFFPSLS